MRKYYKKLPAKRIGAGSLIFDGMGNVLLVKPSYKKYWSIPGGVVEENESPKVACCREIKQEIGITLTNLNFLCVDYTKATKDKNESLQFIFYVGELNKKQLATIKVDGKEINEYRLVNHKQVTRLLGWPESNLARRWPNCLKALRECKAQYLEDGNGV